MSEAEIEAARYELDQYYEDDLISAAEYFGQIALLALLEAAKDE